MSDTGVRNLEHEALGPFLKSYTKRYEQWKRGDLLPIAIQTMPKQVRKDKVLRNLERLIYERENGLREEV